MKLYRFSEDFIDTCIELLNRPFTEEEVQKVYCDMVDHKEYPDFDDWIYDMQKSELVIENVPEINQGLLLLDSIEEIRQRAYEKPEQYPTDYTIRLITAMVASYIGYDNREDWVEILRGCESSKYYDRYHHTMFYKQRGGNSMDKQITGFYTVKDENNVIKQIGKMSVLQPKTKYNGKKTKWFDDSKLLKKN